MSTDEQARGGPVSAVVRVLLSIWYVVPLAVGLIEIPSRIAGLDLVCANRVGAADAVENNAGETRRGESIVN